MIVVGIDPGVRKLWYAVVDFQHDQKHILDCGILFDDKTITNRMDRFEKMSNIYTFFQELSQKYSIDLIAIEKLYFTDRNQSNAEFVYGIRGALITLFYSKHIKIQEIDPVQVKKYITWNGKADKKLVQAKIMQIYGLQLIPEYNDSADALGMARIAKTISPSS